MDEEDDIAAMQMPQPIAAQMPPMVKAAALMMTGEFVLILGILFVLLGLGAFITDFLRIKGSGEVVIGLFLCALAFALVLISRGQMPKTVQMSPPQARPPAARRGKPDDSGSYR